MRRLLTVDRMSTLRACERWIRADLRARKGQALLTVFAVAGIVTALITAATLLEDGTNPWRGLFTRTNGAHIWIHAQDAWADSSTAALSELPGVAAVAGPYRSAPVTLVQDGRKSPVALRALPARPPAVAHPVVKEGRWLDTADPDGVVVERTFAEAVGLRLGSPFPVTALNGTRHELAVAGIAETAEQGFYPEWTPGLAWVLPQTLDRVEPVAARSESVIGLRLDDPEATRLTVQRAVTLLDERVQRVTTWQQVRAAMELDNRLLGLMLALFGAVGLVAAALALANAVGGRVLTHSRDLATLKSLGLTPGQVTGMLVAEHGSLGLLGVVTGLICGRLVTMVALGDGAGLPPSLTSTAVIAGGTVLVVLVAVLLPAWRGGRTPPIPDTPVAPPRGRLSRLARLALLVRLPPALVLGARDAFTRRLPAALTVFGVAIPMMMITIGLCSWATLNNFLAHPEQVGQAAQLIVKSDRMPASEVERIIASDPGVARFYPGSEVAALEPEQTRSVLARAVGTSTDPYPFQVLEGRIYSQRGEAVAGQGLLDLLDVEIGDRVRVTVGGTPLILRIVGRVVEPDQDGEVISFGLDSLAAKDAVPPEFYALVLRPDADPAETRERLLAASGQDLEVRQPVNPAERLAVIRIVIVALTVVLALIGLANLLTAIAVGLRDHAFDLTVLKAMGLTPRQVTATLVTATGLLVVLGVVLGILAGVSVAGVLIDLQGHTSGVGAGIARTASMPTLIVTMLVAVGAALLVAVIPAHRAARARAPVTVR
ncbi:ABC transporter permease [Thermostaphylospora chromogena]|uniref:Putative ABC transport system permease protein n=1 Tax=Thermostaphylospora chromogena TaxID=35622 RepID=A0A1H1EY99_9ACTN|nr:FtsX-like permease family protein [Thermostaphylospora chromogena]SDQ93660.1 putative ABC transport system permease protein [Thermostaphylospora chromogena]